MSKNVVITGIGLVTGKGYQLDKIWDNLFNAQNTGTLDEYCDEITGNDFKKRFMDITPCSTYGCSAAELAWKDAFCSDDDIDRSRWGVYNGTAYGSFTSTVHKVCQEYIKNGPGGLLPGIFNNKSCNVTADIAAISFKLMGANTTFMSGCLASGMAIMQAFDDVKDSELQGVVVIGTEAVDMHLVKSHQIIGERNTDAYTSGGCSFVVQTLEDIDLIKTSPRGYIRAVEAAGCGGRSEYYANDLADSLTRVMNNALKYAGIDAEDINVILSGQGKSDIETLCYSQAFGNVFGEDLKNPIFNTKDALGDSLGAFPAINTALGVLFLEKQAIPSPDRNMDKNIKYVMVTADDPDGNAWALILERFDRVQTGEL